MNKSKTRTFFILIMVIALIAISAAVILYQYYFPSISAQHDHWGQAGDFFGGMLNPVFGFLGLLALLFTIFQQSEELRLTRTELRHSAKAQERQAVCFERESVRTDIYRLIEQLSKRINRNFNENRLDCVPNNPDQRISFHEVLKHGLSRQSNKRFRWLEQSYQAGNVETAQTLKWLKDDLERLSKYIVMYENESLKTRDIDDLFTTREHRTLLVRNFYTEEYRDLIQLMGMILGDKCDKLAEFYSDN